MEQPSVSAVSVRLSESNIIRLEAHDILPSVSNLAREYARAGYPDRYVIFSQQQTDTRITGTRLREGGTDKGVFISCILRPSVFPSQAGYIGAMAAVAMETALEEYITRPLGIGWVSDIYCDGKKIGGVTVEGKLDSFSSYEYIIVTFALRWQESYLPPRLTDMIRKIFASENTSISLLIAKSILNRFFNLYVNLKSPSKFIEIYKQKFVMHGQRVRYICEGKKKIGRILGVDKEDMSLLVGGRSGTPIHITNPKHVTLPRSFRIRRGTLSRGNMPPHSGAR